jgi:PhzF family phenazine biosynthesis protein
MSQNSFKFQEINAFTREGENVIGNPATICLVDEFPNLEEMGDCAKQLGTPMTTFLKPTDDPLSFEIRHFSPDGEENHVCGHASVAAAEYLARLDPDLRDDKTITFKLNPKFGINSDNAFYLKVSGQDISLTMPAVTELERVDDPEFYTLLADALNIDETDIVKPCYYAPRIINYVVELKDGKTLLDMQPDFEKLKTLAASEKFSHEGIMATTPSPHDSFDILNRVFLPIIGVDEDLACGSANCSIIPYWAMIKDNAFPDSQDTFNVLFPYPPSLADGFVGGIQDLELDRDKKEVTVTGQAAWQKEHLITTNPEQYSAPPYNQEQQHKPPRPNSP